MDFPRLENVGNYISLTALRDNTEDPNPFHINMPHLTEIHGQTSNRAIYMYDVDATVIDLSGLERTTTGGITISTNDYVQELRLDALREVSGSLVVDSNVAMTSLAVPAPGATIAGDLKIVANLQLLCFSMNQAVSHFVVTGTTSTTGCLTTFCPGVRPVSYTHLTLPTNREV